MVFINIRELHCRHCFCLVFDTTAHVLVKRPKIRANMLVNDKRKIVILCFFIFLIMAIDAQDPPAEAVSTAEETEAKTPENLVADSKKKSGEQPTKGKGKGKKKKSDNILIHLIESVEDLVKVIL